MNWTEILAVIFEICIIPLLGALTIWLISFLEAKKEEIAVKYDNELLTKYLNMLNDTITDCVLATNQTYVDALKQQGKFDLEAQKIAFDKTYNAVLDIIADDAYMYLTNAVGDLQTYITTRIEANVKCSK